MAVALIAALASAWFEPTTSSPVGARIDVDVMRVGEQAGRGEKKRAAPQTPAREQPQATKPLPSQTGDAVSNAPAPPSPVPADVGLGAAGDDKVTIDGDGRPVSFTINELRDWIRSNNESPGYPRLARMRGEEGVVGVSVVLSARGMPAQSIELKSTSGSELLDKVALETVRSWRFPAFRGRQQLELLFNFKFQLNND